MDELIPRIEDDPAEGGQEGAAGGLAPTAPETTQLPQVIGAIGAASESEEDMETKLAFESLKRHRSQRRRKKVIGIVVTLAVVAVAVLGWVVMHPSGSGGEGEPSIPTTIVMREDFEEVVSATGSAKPISSMVVTPEVDGFVDQVYVHEGDTVAEGDTLITIKNDDLDKAVKRAEIDLKTAKSATSAAWSTYDAAYDAYYADEGTEQAVYETQSAYERAVLDQQTAQQAYDSAVATAAKRTVTAPSAGSIVTMNAVSGAALGSAGTGTGTGTSGNLIQIADLSQMTVTVQVNEADISKVAVGQTASVTFSALPDVQLDATVTRISTMASGDGNSGGMGYGVVSYDVDLLIPEPAAGLKPGMTASVSIKIQSVPGALTVPASALVQLGEDSWCVYVVTNPETGEAEPRDVTVVTQTASTAVIEGNVQEGDTVQLMGFTGSTGEGDGMSDGSAAIAY